MIQHTVAFIFKDTVDSNAILDFFDAAKKLATIKGVQDFKCLKQTGKKNKFRYGLSMIFASQELYEQYNNHPEHLNFINEYWLKNIEDFLETDYEPL